MFRFVARFVWHCGAKKLGARIMLYALDREYRKYRKSVD